LHILRERSIVIAPVGSKALVPVVKKAVYAGVVVYQSDTQETRAVADIW
jgi:ABC-type sugar transport system substrate-binding protein